MIKALLIFSAALLMVACHNNSNPSTDGSDTSLQMVNSKAIKNTVNRQDINKNTGNNANQAVSDSNANSVNNSNNGNNAGVNNGANPDVHISSEKPSHK